MGPQNSGLLAGRKDLIAAAQKNYMNPGSSRGSIGRPAKVSKETIVGLVTAIELFLESDHAAVWDGWRAQARHIASRVQGIKGLHVTVEEGMNRQGPQPVIYLGSDWKGPSPDEIRKRLRQGNPPIYCGGGQFGNDVSFAMVNVQPGEEKIIADRLVEILKQTK
jgi:L-seryl-tRNA(Ser) seleniumtransferase